MPEVEVIHTYGSNKRITIACIQAREAIIPDNVNANIMRRPNLSARLRNKGPRIRATKRVNGKIYVDIHPAEEV